MIILNVFDTIKRVRDEGLSLLLVEQNIHHTLELADRRNTIETGRITIHGTGKELLENEYVKKTYLGML